MVFAAEWNALYAKSRHLSVWPWSDVVTLVMRHARPPVEPAAYRVLEIGVGAGANIPFFQALGVEFYGIDGSAVVVDRLRQTYPELRERLFVADFAGDWPVDVAFDLIVDRGSLTHNSGADIAKTLRRVQAQLVPGGRLIAVDLFSTAFDEYSKGRPTSDAYTRCDFVEGRLAGTGRAHFADEERLAELFAGFEIEFLEHKEIRRHVPSDGACFAAWNIVARIVEEA